MELCKSWSRWLLVLLVLVLSWAGRARAQVPETNPVLRLQERFVTVLGDEEGIEALAAWRGDQGETRVLATAKESNRVHVLDGDSGETLSQFGGPGSGPGQFGRPYGIVVSGSLAAVVERENRRVQVLQLPAGRPVGTFGEDVFVEPYGVSAVSGPQGLSLFVTDNHDLPDGSGATARVHQFSLTAVPYAARWVRTFGTTSGAGRLGDVEAVQVDYVHQRLLVADEEQQNVKVFTLAGRFTGQIMGEKSFRHEPEGIACIRAATRATGWWPTKATRRRCTGSSIERP